MKNFLVAASYLALAHASSPPVFTLGPSSNYLKAPTATATPGRHEVKISPKIDDKNVPKDGVDVFFGSDLQAAIKSTLSSDACKAEGVSNDCATAVGNAINEHHALTVESRQLGAVAIGVTSLVGFIGAIVGFSRGKGPQVVAPQHLHIPASDLSAIQSQTATNIAIATSSGASPITLFVTPTPKSSPGQVSILTADNGEHKKGDATIGLPTGMADIIDQIILKSSESYSKECLSGSAQKRGLHERDSSKARNLYPGLLESIRRLTESALNSVGTSSDNLIDIESLGADGAILPTITDAGVVAAMKQSNEYAAQLTAFHGKAAEFIEESSNEIFFTVWAYCSYNLGAGGISPVYVPPSHEDSEDKCPPDLDCSDDKCKGKDSKCTAEGTYKDCDCSSGNGTARMIKQNGGDKETLQWYSDVLQQMLGESNTPASEKHDPVCDTKALSGVPFNVFTGSSFGKSNVYDGFCRAVETNPEQNMELTWTTDASGKQKSSKLRAMKRTPPPDASSYDSYSFKLNFKPRSGSSCSQSCKDAFASISRDKCGHQGSATNLMTASGSLDVGCGTYSYEITGKDVPAVQGPPKPFLTTQYCFPKDAFGPHRDIDPNEQALYVGFACPGTASPKNDIKKGDSSTFVNWNTTNNEVPFKYTIVWEDNCESTNTEMNIRQPIRETPETTCETMMLNNYRNCDNGGIGGSVNVGCVKYEFKSSFEKSSIF